MQAISTIRYNESGTLVFWGIVKSKNESVTSQNHEGTLVSYTEHEVAKIFYIDPVYDELKIGDSIQLPCATTTKLSDINA